jgi:hypothetical protein
VLKNLVESNRVAQAIYRFVLDLKNEVKDENKFFKGSITGLLERLNNHEKIFPDRIPKDWPKTASQLGSILKRFAPALREKGVQVEWSRSGRERIVTLKLVGEKKANDNSDSTMTAENTVCRHHEIDIPKACETADDSSDGKLSSFSVEQLKKKEEIENKKDEENNGGKTPSLPSLGLQICPQHIGNVCDSTSENVPSSRCHTAVTGENRTPTNNQSSTDMDTIVEDIGYVVGQSTAIVRRRISVDAA